MRQVFTAAILLVTHITFAQSVERISIDSNHQYVAIRPPAKNISAAIVMLTSFAPPEFILAETKLQNTAYANGMLTVVLPMQQMLTADTFAIQRLNRVLADVSNRFGVAKSKFILGGYDEAGNIALRYTELAAENTGNYFLKPAAVFGIDTPVDLFGLWRWSENQIKKSYWQGAVGDAKFYLDKLTKEYGTITQNISRYSYLTPFETKKDTSGNEKSLKDTPIRLYYDADINWHLTNRRNSFYDTKIPDGSEMIKRLLLMGNARAELVLAKQPGMRSNGTRSPNSVSMVDEVDFIQWVKTSLDIFDPVTYTPKYYLPAPEGWDKEIFSLPPDFASEIPFQGLEDIRFAPGWGDIKSAEHWSYGFLWWLGAKPEVDITKLQSSLQQYYTGLVSRNVDSSMQIPVVVKLKVFKPANGDLQTFSGTINMLDYHEKKPIVLNCMIHVKDLKSNNSAIYFAISPQPAMHAVWKELNAIGENISIK